MDTPMPFQSILCNWQTTPAEPTAVGARRGFFKGPTGTLANLSVHITTLNPGNTPHPPHRHADEELIIVKDGELEATVEGRTFAVPAGSMLLIAPNEHHGWRNAGSVPATYYVMRWIVPTAI